MIRIIAIDFDRKMILFNDGAEMVTEESCIEFRQPFPDQHPSAGPLNPIYWKALAQDFASKAKAPEYPLPSDAVQYAKIMASQFPRVFREICGGGYYECKYCEEMHGHKDECAWINARRICGYEVVLSGGLFESPMQEDEG